ncbi:MAG TPA: prolyl oligopeptidase family serine peptidase [Blastocatellia bacterium]|nr:prolyl oligopeptidase family serine peptidase [Blastocatellia bacterium]
MSSQILPRALAQPPHNNDLTRQETDPGAPKLVSFTSGDLTLRGFLYKPEGEGPFPAIIWNHGSEKLPGQQPELARFYTKQGFVFFLPHRHGHGRSPGDYIQDLIEKYSAMEKNRTLVERRVVKLQEEYNQDVVAAVEWLRGQSFVDQERLVMSGCSYGGIQTLLAAEKGLGLRAFVPFAPAAMSWANTELRKRLLEAVRGAKAPLFLIQARNDYGLGPSDVLGPVIKQKGPPNQAKIYPPYGTTPQEGHAAFATKEGGIAIWGSDVLDFFRALIR